MDWTPLHQAARRGDVTAVLSLLDSETGHAKAVAALLDAGCHASAADALGRTALLHACASGSVEACRLVIDRGASLVSMDHKGRTALHYAANGDNSDIVGLLLNLAPTLAEHRDSIGSLPCHAAASLGNVELLQMLLVEYVNHRISPDVKDLWGRTCLHLATYQSHLHAMEFIIGRSRSLVDEPDIDVITPLLVAAHQGHLRAVRLLLSSGANVLHEDAWGRSALSMAVYSGMAQSQMSGSRSEGNIDTVSALAGAGDLGLLERQINLLSPEKLEELGLVCEDHEMPEIWRHHVEQRLDATRAMQQTCHIPPGGKLNSGQEEGKPSNGPLLREEVRDGAQILPWDVVRVYRHRTRVWAGPLVWSSLDKAEVKAAAEVIAMGALAELVEVRAITDPDNPAYRTGNTAKGLFAAKDIELGTVLGEYGGRVRYCDQVEQDSSLGGGRLGEYSVELHGCSSELGSGDRLAPCFCTPEIELVIDASRDINPIGYINDFRDQSGRRLRHPNAQFISILVKGWSHIIAMATEAVPMGGEILVDYGERFWTEAGLAD